jgi:DNA mismatch repair protein MutS2
MDLSTFSAHIKGIKAIVDEAASGDLVLIDEIGTGTDPHEGAALAMAVMEVLTSRGVLTVVTTHQGTLKAFAHNTPGIANGSMAFDKETLKPTYKFCPDMPGSSYALEIAKRMGLSDAIVTRSRSLMGDQVHRLEDLILQLQDKVEQNDQMERELKARELVLEGLTKRYQEENDRLAREVRQLRRKAAEEASAIIRHANAAVEKAIRTVREQSATRRAIREAKELIQEEKETVSKELEATSFDEESWHEDQITGKVRAGNRVYWTRGGGVVATVLSAEDMTGHVLIASGNLKVRVPKVELIQTKGLEKAASGLHSHVSVPFPDNVRTEIDIRGMQVDEALETVDKFVNDAMLAGLREVRIIHGVGTGALRNSVIPFLKQHPLVHTTLPAGLHQENLGVTIAKIAGR